MGKRVILDDVEVTWSPWLGNNGEKRGLERTQKGFQFLTRKGADVTFFEEFQLNNLLELEVEFCDGRTIRWNLCGGETRDVNYETGT